MKWFSYNSWWPTCHQHNGLFVWMQLHLSGDPRPIEVGVPPALLLVLRVLVLVSGSDERDPKVSLLAVHGDFLMLGRCWRSRVLLSCNSVISTTDVKSRGKASGLVWHESKNNNERFFKKRSVCTVGFKVYLLNIKRKDWYFMSCWKMKPEKVFSWLIKQDVSYFHNKSTALAF